MHVWSVSFSYVHSGDTIFLLLYKRPVLLFSCFFFCSREIADSCRSSGPTKSSNRTEKVVYMRLLEFFFNTKDFWVRASALDPITLLLFFRTKCVWYQWLIFQLLLPVLKMAERLCFYKRALRHSWMTLSYGPSRHTPCSVIYWEGSRHDRLKTVQISVQSAYSWIHSKRAS